MPEISRGALRWHDVGLRPFEEDKMQRLSFSAPFLAFLAVWTMTLPAEAKVEKIMNLCAGQNGATRLCPVYRPSFAPPKGWWTDKESGASQGVDIFVPDGATFRSAPALIYGDARYNPEKTPLAQWVENSDKHWVETGEGDRIEALSAEDLGAGKREVIIHRYHNRDKNQPVELIGYFVDTDNDGNSFVVRLTLSGLSAEKVEKERPVFNQLIKGY